MDARSFDFKLHSSHVQVIVNLDTVLPLGFTLGFEVFANSRESLAVKPVSEPEVDVAVFELLVGLLDEELN